MILDVSELLSKKKIRKPVELEISENELVYGDEEVEFSKPIYFKGILSMVGDILHLEGQLSTELNLRCSRCLEMFKYPVELEVEEKFSSHPEDNDDDILLLEGESISLTEIIENNILIALPIKKLCRVECKGLCQSCGTNLNLTTCKCEEENIDPRLEKLKDLFSKS